LLVDAEWFLNYKVFEFYIALQCTVYSSDNKPYKDNFFEEPSDLQV
jgi:hypothetical protein